MNHYTYLFGLLALLWGMTGNAVEIATGERFEYPEKKFSIVPPAGFEVYDDVAGVFLSIREKPRKGLLYERNFQVYWNDGYHHIDDAAAKKLASEIGAKFTKYSPHITDYQVSRYSLVDLGDHEGIVFYNSYKIEDNEMMQVVLLISASSEYFLVTYTDLLKNYEKNEGNSVYGDLWWDCFTSIIVEGSPPYRYRFYVVAGGALAAFVFLGLPIYFIRRKKSSKFYSSFVHESDSHQGDVEMIDDEDSAHDIDIDDSAYSSNSKKISDTSNIEHSGFDSSHGEDDATEIVSDHPPTSRPPASKRRDDDDDDDEWAV